MKRIRITIRQDGFLVLRSRAVRRAWCPDCGTEEEMVVASVGDRWIDLLPVHRSQTTDGALLICMKSLLSVANTKTDSPRHAVKQKMKELL